MHRSSPISDEILRLQVATSNRIGPTPQQFSPPKNDSNRHFWGMKFLKRGVGGGQFHCRALYLTWIRLVYFFLNTTYWWEN